MYPPIAQWNKDRDVWEAGEANLFSEHLDVFSETFPKSGMTRNGMLYPRPQWAHHTGGIEYSSLPGLPSPRASDWRASSTAPAAMGHAESGMGSLPEVVGFQLLRVGGLGKYQPALDRWGLVAGRAAPPATTLTAKGKHKLSARFVEWMMGVADGWITGSDIGLTRAQALKAAGNGVVPQQAKAALIWLLGRRNGEETNSSGHEK